MAASNPNMRLVWDNAADRASLSVSSAAGSLDANNLKRNLKSQVWRALSTSASIVCGWDSREPVGCVALAFTNFTSEAVMRVRGYSRHDSLIPEFDSGEIPCAPAAALGAFPWGTPLGENFYSRGGASTFSYGYGGYGVYWVPGGRAVAKLDILVSDPNNPDGYLEVGRLIVGPYWSPMYNFSFNHSLGFAETSAGGRTEAGDLRHEQGAKWRTMEFSLDYMDSEDRAALMRIRRMKGISEAFFISLFPENEDTLLEQSYQMWGKFSDNGQVINPTYGTYSSSLNVEEM